MKEYKREYPFFALCGLNCGLCPRYQTEGVSKCPGCGGKDFHLLHPACSVITCNKKHDKVEYCYQCSSYPCERYNRPNNCDSFVSYKNILSDFQKAKKYIEKYKNELDEKMHILEFLINDFNDGRRKSYYCTAVNLLGIEDLRDIIHEINDRIAGQETPLKNKIDQVLLLFGAKADKKGIELKLRKQR